MGIIPPLSPIVPPIPGGAVDDALVKDEHLRASQLIHDESGWRGHSAVIARGIMGAESGFNPDADNGICCVGIMQVNLIHKGKYGIPADEAQAKTWLKNPRNNVRASYKIFLVQGWGAWETFTNGSYRLHMNQDPVIQVKKNTASGAVGGAVSGAVDKVLGPIDEVASALLSPDTWFRIGKGYLGSVLVILGVGAATFIVATRSGAVKSTVKTASKVVPAGKAAGAVRKAVK